jgi:hypothetical protein
MGEDEGGGGQKVVGPPFLTLPTRGGEIIWVI